MRLPTIFLKCSLCVLSILCVFILKTPRSDSHEKVETYRGACWGMTKDEIEILETSRGNTLIDAKFDDNRVAYSIYDLLDSRSETNRCVYIFDGEGGTLSSFTIGSVDDGDDLFEIVVDELRKKYGEGEYGSTKGDGILYLNADWDNGFETIEGIFFGSSLRNEAYFTFTYNDDVVDSE